VPPLQDTGWDNIQRADPDKHANTAMTAEIRAFEYAMGLFSVLIGLAVADIATSFHRLIRNQSQVGWDPLALLSALYALCTAIAMWFDIWGVRNFAATRHFFFYLALVAQLFVLFLLAATSLPDELDGPIDLRSYHARNRRYFWGLIVLFQAMYFGLGLFFVSGQVARLPAVVASLLLTQMCAPLAISLVLLWVRSRVVEYVGFGMLFVVMALHYAAAQIN